MLPGAPLRRGARAKRQERGRGQAGRSTVKVEPCTPCRPTKAAGSAPGRNATGSSCVHPDMTPRGRTRSKRTSDPCETFVVAGSNHPNHTAATHALHTYLR